MSDAPPPCPTPFNLADHALWSAEAAEDKIALAVMGPARAERWSYGRLRAAVLGMAGGLQAMDLPMGARILLRLDNSPAFPVAFLGAIAAGHVPVPTAAGLTPGEVTTLARAIGPDLILAEGDLALPEGPWPVRRDLGALMSHPPGEMRRGCPEDIAYIVFTSGSSGRPKPVAHAHRAIWARRMMHEGWYGLRAEDRHCHTGAFNWTFTLGTGLLDPWSLGATALVPAPGTPVEALPLLLKRHDATILAGAPGVFRKLLSGAAPLSFPKLRHGLSAGEALAPALRARWRAATGTDLHEALGMSECSTFISGSPARPAPEGTIGYPQPGRRIAVLDEAALPDAQAVPQGEAEVLAVHESDPGLMRGYLDADGAPDLPLSDAWFVTGDLVSEDPDGALRYHGRRDAMITAGGFRISPVELETLFATAEGVSDCAALSLAPSPDTTIVALAYAGDATETALATLAEARLARYKQPRAFIRLPALPRTATGKIDRQALRPIAQEHLA